MIRESASCFESRHDLYNTNAIITGALQSYWLVLLRVLVPDCVCFLARVVLEPEGAWRLSGLAGRFRCATTLLSDERSMLQTRLTDNLGM